MLKRHAGAPFYAVRKSGVQAASLAALAEKHAIERAVGRVQGVKAIAVEVDVTLEPGQRRSDSEIAAAAESALEWHSLVPADRIQVKVERGWVTLNGAVEWDFQRQNSWAERAAAFGAAGAAPGATSVVNGISVEP